MASFDMIDFPLDHPAMPQVLSMLGVGEAVAIKRPGVYPYMACYWNVSKVVAKQGGEMVLGWMLMERPGLYVEAMHHGVWRNRDGQLLDVTDVSPKYRRTTPTTFVPDDRIKTVDLGRPVQITSHFFPLAEDAGIRTYIDAYLENNKAAIKQNEILFERPIPGWEPGKAVAPQSFTESQRNRLAVISPTLNTSKQRITAALDDLRRRQADIVAG